MFTNLLFKIQTVFSKYTNSVSIKTVLKGSKLRIKGNGNTIEIFKSDIKRLKISIDGSDNQIIIKKGVSIRDLDIIIQGNGHKISIGDFTNIAQCSMVCCYNDAKIDIGDSCMIAPGVKFKTCDGHTIFQDKQIINNAKDIKIEQNVWIAEDVAILKGVEIGKNSVVGIKSLVTANIFPKESLLVGIPAKVIKNNIGWDKASC